MTIACRPGNHVRGNNTGTSIQANSERKYRSMTSHMSLSACANVPTNTMKMDIANRTTVSLSDARGRKACRRAAPMVMV